MAVIEVEGLNKEYRRFRRPPVTALRGLDLSVPEGGVFGFLGPNGSGKTTTIRCLLGLVRPSSGVCRVLGADTRKQLPAVIPRVGSLVESPGLFPGLTGRENLALLGRLDRIGAQSVDQALTRVGLAERADDPVGGFSLGMRQRLGLAAALLKDPSLLILDEPANGLDPAGIKEVRDILINLGHEGRTVFVSSHLLSEVRLTCDNVAILSKGRCVASGSVQSVLAGHQALGLMVRLPPPQLDAGLQTLRAVGFSAGPAGDLMAVGIVIAGLITFLKTSYISQSAYQAKVVAAQASFNTKVTPPPGLSFCQPGQKPTNCVPRPTVTVHDPRFHLTSLKNVFGAVSAVLAVLVALIGASVIGAEWPSRTITTILTWEPRRLRVLAAKSIATVVVSVVLAVATLVVLGLALLPAALIHGTTMGTTGAWWRSLAGVLGRGTALVALVALMGFAIATVGRNTAAALIVFFGYTIIVERFLTVLVHGWAKWLLIVNAAVLVTGQRQSVEGHVRTFWPAVIYLIAIAAGLYLVAALDFRRRDVA